MPNIANILKGEFVRIARKEVRAETLTLKKQSAQYRREIAALKREVAALQRDASRRRDVKPASAAAVQEEPAGPALRFRAKGFAAHRRRLGLSAAQAGALLGVSGQSIYHWEAGKAKPRDVSGG